VWIFLVRHDNPPLAPIDKAVSRNAWALKELIEKALLALGIVFREDCSWLILLFEQLHSVLGIIIKIILNIKLNLILLLSIIFTIKIPSFIKGGQAAKPPGGFCHDLRVANFISHDGLLGLVEGPN
jgi:hypothetical protein